MASCRMLLPSSVPASPYLFSPSLPLLGSSSWISLLAVSPFDQSASSFVRREREGRSRGKLSVNWIQAQASVSSPVATEPNILCEACQGRGWLLCDFCNGEKTNVQVKNNRFYRRCPSCRAVGVLICPQCKVFKCVTFPNSTDGGVEL